MSRCMHSTLYPLVPGQQDGLAIAEESSHLTTHCEIKALKYIWNYLSSENRQTMSPFLDA